jgi:hypothetical protein
MTVPPHRGVMGGILPGLEGEGINRKLLVHDRSQKSPAKAKTCATTFVKAWM